MSYSEAIGGCSTIMFQVQAWQKWRPVFGGLTLVLTGATQCRFNRNQKAFYADSRLVAFVRPGLAIKIASARSPRMGRSV